MSIYDTPGLHWNPNEGRRYHARRAHWAQVGYTGLWCLYLPYTEITKQGLAIPCHQSACGLFGHFRGAPDEDTDLRYVDKCRECARKA